MRQLHDLAFRNQIGRIRQYVENTHIADRYHHLESAGIQEIADKYRRRIAERYIGAGNTASQLCFIHHIVMQQCRGMNELDRCSQRTVTCALISQCPGHQQHENGSNPLPAGIDDIFRNRADQRDIRMHLLTDNPVDRLQIRQYRRKEGITGIICLVLAQYGPALFRYSSRKYQVNGSDYTMHTFRMLISASPNATVIQILRSRPSQAARPAPCPRDYDPYPSPRSAIRLPRNDRQPQVSCQAYT